MLHYGMSANSLTTKSHAADFRLGGARYFPDIHLLAAAPKALSNAEGALRALLSEMACSVPK